MSALRKVLVVDDDRAVARSFDRVLTQKGYAVITAHDAHEALERLRAEEVDLVFTDIRMPGMDGLELAEKVKARRPWTPVVIVTGYGTPAAEERARAAGVSGFLHKPLSPEAIEDSTASALQSASGRYAAEAEAAVAEVGVAETTEAPARRSAVKDVALFVLAPFIGLVYAVFLPFVGLAVLGWLGAKALGEKLDATRFGRALKHVATGIAAPFFGLAFVVALPLAGAVGLAWTIAKAATERPEAE